MVMRKSRLPMMRLTGGGVLRDDFFLSPPSAGMAKRPSGSGVPPGSPASPALPAPDAPPVLPELAPLAPPVPALPPGPCVPSGTASQSGGTVATLVGSVVVAMTAPGGAGFVVTAPLRATEVAVAPDAGLPSGDVVAPGGPRMR